MTAARCVLVYGDSSSVTLDMAILVVEVGTESHDCSL